MKRPSYEIGRRVSIGDDRRRATSVKHRPTSFLARLAPLPSFLLRLHTRGTKFQRRLCALVIDCFQIPAIAYSLARLPRSNPSEIRSLHIPLIAPYLELDCKIYRVTCNQFLFSERIVCPADGNDDSYLKLGLVPRQD